VLDGWLELTPELLEERRTALCAEDLKRFYDGQEPQWRHALAPPGQIPRRPVAVDGLAKLRENPTGAPPMVLLVGPDGTGKSTALCQMACDLVADGRRVWFRSPGARLDIAGMPAGDEVILVSDEADEIAPDIEKAVEQLARAGRKDIRWLLCARDVAWKARFIRNGRSLEPAWEQFVDLWPTLSNRSAVLTVTAVTTAASAGLGAWAASGTQGAVADAPDILGAWDTAGCLGALADVAPSERADALEVRAKKKHEISDATLLGASLELRYGADGLAGLVEESVTRLDGDPAQEAFLFIAAAQVAGVDGLDLLVLADLIGLARADGREAIGGRLAKAGLASGSGGVLRVRHPALARVAIQLLAAKRVPGDIEELYRRLIRGTATTGNDVKALAAGGAIMNCGPLLSEKLLQLGLQRERCDQVACAVADEAEQALPDFLLFSVARARTYRAAGRRADARRVLRARLADATIKNDWDVIGRSYLHELSGPETALARLAEGATLAGLALADAEGLGQVTMADGKLALLALGNACTELAQPIAQPIAQPTAQPAGQPSHEAGGGPEGSALFRRQLRACTHLGEKVTPKWDQRARFDFHTFKVAADEYGIPVTTAAEALCWLAETLTATLGMVEDAEIADLARRLAPDGDALTFSHLEYTIGLGRLPWAKE